MLGRQSTPGHWDRFWSNLRSANPRPVFLKALRVGFALAGKRALEVGAGTGTASSSVAAEGGRVVALDYSDESVRFIKKNWVGKLPTLTPLRADALALPFADSSFDVVFHDGVLEHFPDPQRFLGENWRVLKPGGLLVVGVPQKYNPYTLYKQVLILLNRWRYGWETQYSVGQLAALLRGSGFRVGQVYGDGIIGSFGPRTVRLAQRIARWWDSQPTRGPSDPAGMTNTGTGEELIFRISQLRILPYIAFCVVMTGLKPIGPNEAQRPTAHRA